MKMARAGSAAMALLALAGPAAAHPHMFVDTRLEAIFDGGGRLTAVRITWIYDELTTLMSVTDGGYDKDGDGALSVAEMEPLQGFDMEWGEDFLGDFQISRGAEKLALVPGPQDWTSDWKDGHLISTHVRRLAVPVDPATGPLVLKPFDPGYYTAYAIIGTPEITGRSDCTAQVFEPDLTKAQKALAAALDEYNPNQSLEEMGYLMIGESYAEEVRLTCGD
ncbi:DUF1007 family protein [Frigidibacter mobilis]|nr:DUF1007 family protein [Frigidibacter mobilis]